MTALIHGWIIPSAIAKTTSRNGVLKIPTPTPSDWYKSAADNKIRLMINAPLGVSLAELFAWAPKNTNVSAIKAIVAMLPVLREEEAVGAKLA